MDGSARPATAEDAIAVAALAAAARDAVASQRGGPLLLAREPRRLEPAALEDPNRLMVVGALDDVPVGYASVVLEALSDGQFLAVIEALFVEPDAREMGVGEAMMDLVLHWAAGQGVVGLDALALPGDRATKNFFERFGLTARAIVVHRALNDEE